MAIFFVSGIAHSWPLATPIASQIAPNRWVDQGDAISTYRQAMSRSPAIGPPGDDLRLLADAMGDPVAHYRELPAWKTRASSALVALGAEGLALSLEFNAKTQDLNLPAPTLAEDWDVWEYEGRVRDAVAIILRAADEADRRADQMNAATPRVSPNALREAIAETIAVNVKAYDIAAVCVALGLDPCGPNEDPMRSKRVYVTHKLIGMMGAHLIEVARAVDDEYGDPDLAGIAAAYSAQLSIRLAPGATVAGERLAQLHDWVAVQRSWDAALAKVVTDPEGAITAARTTLESVCKHICDERAAPYESGWDLSRLYKAAASAMDVAPDQHSEQVIKQILSGVTTVVDGLAAMRNSMSDSHGRGKGNVRPLPRHAKLAVNAAFAVAGFLIDTHVEKGAR
jgi:hypothetical protein